ncbi:MAG: archease [Candidatus Hodarchaeota archaeon]
MSNIGHEFLDHTADIQVHAWAPTLEELFKEIGLVLMGVMVEGPKVAIEREIEVKVEAEDLQALLFDWLTEFLYYMDTEHFVVGDISIKELKRSGESAWKIDSVLMGENFKSGHHVSGTEVKAITYSYMQIEKREDNLYHLMIILDI